jgi:hypothetical protein
MKPIISHLKWVSFGVVSACLGVVWAGELPPAVERAVSFQEEVFPILEKNCFDCHGPETQKSGFRLDGREAAMKGGDYGTDILVGNSAESPLIHYVAQIDKDMVMPPKGDPLTAEQVGILRAWIDQGLKWNVEVVAAAEVEAATQAHIDHWSFKVPVRPEPPPTSDNGWAKNPIDRFILHRLDSEGLAPSPEADRATLIRRLHLDLIGLPPASEEVDDFLADESPDAYERLVDRLLASPHYGEKWARWWLDAARYADTNGYEKDRPRSIWPYRDWVIDAFNEDMPFDRFTIEQIAGDMLTDAAPSQIVATGFHRNTMINEEGGIDVAQFRYESVVDRVHTTATVFLGLTMACCQCHDHKYDPITQREYFEFFAFLNNADEPDYSVPDPEVREEREKIEAKIERIESDYENSFPPYEEIVHWTPLDPNGYRAENGSVLAKLEDGSILALGPTPATDVYHVEVGNPPEEFEVLRLEALPEERLGSKGIGRTRHGNFVLNEFCARLQNDDSRALEFRKATADFSQTGFAVSGAIDGESSTGWGVDDKSGDLNKPRTAEFRLVEGIRPEEASTLELDLSQTFGDEHLIRRFRISAGRIERRHYRPELTEQDQREYHLLTKFGKWEEEQRPKARNWTVLEPVEMESENYATLSVLEDSSILVTGDHPNRDIYTVVYETPLDRITGIRIEALPHPDLPGGGPGRGTVMDDGTFILTELLVHASPIAAGSNVEAVTLDLADPSATFSDRSHTPDKALDRISDTGWSVKGGAGKAHTAVFSVSRPLEIEGGARLEFRLEQTYIHQQTIGRFRISVTTDLEPKAATGFPARIEAILATAPEKRTDEEKDDLKRYYLTQAPELSESHKRVASLRQGMPHFPKTLVMAERKNLRKTHIHPRGEFLRTGREVAPDIPAVLPQIPEGVPPNRLAFARWIASPTNPLIGRVTLNRLWGVYFGKPLVTTPEDFGTQGAEPSHPELLDWLAVEFANRGWRLKEMSRLIVTSSTYRQTSRVTPELLERDPENALLARGPRFRVGAETVRDIALTASGLLSPKIGGPSVFPPQPEGVTDIAYGSSGWKTSEGEDRYRRGLYTYLKRTAPYPAFGVFDAPPPETSCIRRRRSNTPLQALTLLNDEVFVEASQALAGRVIEEVSAENRDRIREAFKICLSRPPSEMEEETLLAFFDSQVERFRKEDADCKKIAGDHPASATPDADLSTVAALTTVARAILNLDETITKE